MRKRSTWNDAGRPGERSVKAGMVSRLGKGAGAGFVLALALVCAAGAAEEADRKASGSGKMDRNIPGLEITGSYTPSYATGFSITDYTGGCSMISVKDGTGYLVVPEGANVPDDLPDGVTLVRQPVKSVYLANSAGMCRFDSIGAVDCVAFSGVDMDDWEIASAADAMKHGSMVYAGKYSAPDYELLLTGGCDLAIENLMILHKPEVMEKLTTLGIPVFLDRSSEESEPLGRTEWVIPYGVLTGKREEAEFAFDEQADMVLALKDLPETGKTTAYFYVNSQGQIVCPKSVSSVPKMIQCAGGTYVPEGLDDESTGLASQVRMDMESFLTKAGDADCLIYDATINPVSSLQDLLDINPLFGKFKAVREGNVYITRTSMYQNSDKTGSIIRDFHTMLTGSGDMEYISKAE